MTDKEKESIFVNEIMPESSIVYKICHQYTNTSDDFNDLFQEIMYQLWRSLPNYNCKSKITTWIYKVALNTSLCFLRKEKRTVLTTGLSSEYFNIPELTNNSMNSQLDLLKKLIGKLSKMEKAIIMLHLDEYSNDEISTIVGISKTNVSTRLNRIKQKLLNSK